MPYSGIKQWSDTEPLYKVNKNCPICGKEIKCCPTGVDGSWFDKIRLCSTKCNHEFIRRIWKMALAKETK